MNNTFKRIRTGLPKPFLFTATFLVAFSLGSVAFYIFNYTPTPPIITRLDERTALPPAIPKLQSTEPITKPDASPFQGLWRVYWPSEDGTLPELKHLPVISLMLYADQDHFSGKAFLYEVRDDGYGEYVEKMTEAVLTDIRMHKGALYFHVHDADEDTAYKLWLVNHDEAKLCVVGDGPATVFRVKRGHQ